MSLVSGALPTQVPGEQQGTPRLVKCPLRHPKVSLNFNISPMVSALPDLALAPSYASPPVTGPRTYFFVATPLPGLLRFVLRLALALPWPHFRLDLCCLGPASPPACPNESSYDMPDSYFTGPDHVLARY